jgi:hypothetical protein
MSLLKVKQYHIRKTKFSTYFCPVLSLWFHIFPPFCVFYNIFKDIPSMTNTLQKAMQINTLHSTENISYTQWPALYETKHTTIHVKMKQLSAISRGLRHPTCLFAWETNKWYILYLNFNLCCRDRKVQPLETISKAHDLGNMTQQIKLSGKGWVRLLS